MADRARARRERDEESGRHERLRRQLQMALQGRGVVEPARELNTTASRGKEGWGAGGDVATHSVTGAWLPRSPRPHTTRASMSGPVGKTHGENGVPRLPRTPRAARSGNAFRTTRTIADLCEPQRHAWLPSGHGTRNTDLTNYSRASLFAPRSPRLPSMADSSATESNSSLVEPTLEFRTRNFWPTAAGNFSPGDWRK